MDDTVWECSASHCSRSKPLTYAPLPGTQNLSIRFCGKFRDRGLDQDQTPCDTGCLVRTQGVPQSTSFLYLWNFISLSPKFRMSHVQIRYSNCSCSCFYWGPFRSRLSCRQVYQNALFTNHRSEFDLSDVDHPHKVYHNPAQLGEREATYHQMQLVKLRTYCLSGSFRDHRIIKLIKLQTNEHHPCCYWC